MVTGEKVFSRSAEILWNSSARQVLISITVLIFRSLLPVGALYIVKYLIDTITGTPSSFPGGIEPGVTWLVTGLTFLLLADDFLSSLGSYNSDRQSFLLEKHISSLIHKQSSELGLRFFENPVFHDLLYRASSDISWRPAALVSGAVTLLRGTVSFIAMAVILGRLSLIVPAVLVLAILPLLRVRIKSSGRLYKTRRSQTAISRQASYFSWLITGERPAREVRLFDLHGFFEELYRKYFSKSKTVELLALKRKTRLEWLASLVKMIFFAGILIYASLSFIDRRISAGEAAMYLVAFRQAMVYLRDAVSGLSGIMEDRLYLKDLFSFLDLDRSSRDRHEEKSIPSFQYLEARDVSFSYDTSSAPAVAKVNLRISRGEKIAVVGPNGSGKTTLVKLLSGLYEPASGSVLLNGNDIRQYAQDEYRKYFSVVFQDFMLYYLTAGENISLGDTSSEPDTARIKHAASLSGAASILEKLPDGYDTLLGHHTEGGRELSWGEWQKIAIARALYRDAPVLILDEPSSSLDADSEYDIFSRLGEITGDRTCILISHRLSNIMAADRIIVLDQGYVAETGTHEELMSSRGKYYSMYTRQKSMYR